MSALQTTTPRPSLFQITSELFGLIEQREDALERARAGEDVMDELAVVRGLIRQYLHGHLANKTDACAFTIQELEARAELKGKKAAELRASANRDEETAKDIRAMVLEVMQEFNQKKFPGNMYTIARQGNGGMQALTVKQPELLPDSFQMVNVRMSLEEWKKVRPLIEKKKIVCEAAQPDPNNSAIRAVLEPAEAKRKAILAEAERNGLSSADESVAKQLNDLPGVPGCHLEPRGEGIRIR